MTPIYRLLLGLVLLTIKPGESKAYSVLTHEALIDASWDKFLVPLLKAKFPQLPDSTLKELHAYAYGGAVAPDMGYYPFGSVFFTDLVHYVRSGDFIEALLEEAKTPEEYSFALGSLCHYYADVYGHSVGVNVSVPIEYPKDELKYGKIVTYVEDETAHKRVEFAFDVSETAKGNYASQAYHDFIGFKVADSLLDRAFYKTYSLHLTDVFKNFSRAVNTFRWAVKSFFPELTKAAWSTRKAELQKQNPTLAAKQFRYTMKRATYNKEFGRKRDKPKAGAFLLGALIRILPKVGPLKALKFKAPGPQVEKIYIQSFDTVKYFYTATLQELHHTTVSLLNKDLDTGKESKRAEYKLADATYNKLLLKLQENKFSNVSAGLKKDLLLFFDVPVTTPSKPAGDEDEKLQTALENLKELPAADLH